MNPTVPIALLAAISLAGCEQESASRAAETTPEPSASISEFLFETTLEPQGAIARVGFRLPICVEVPPQRAILKFARGDDSEGGVYETRIAGREIRVSVSYDNWFPGGAISNRQLEEGLSREGRKVFHAQFFRDDPAMAEARSVEDYSEVDDFDGWIVESIDLSPLGGFHEGESIKAYFKHRPGDQESARWARTFASTAQVCPPELRSQPPNEHRR